MESLPTRQIPPIEEKIYKKINFLHKYLSIEQKYTRSEGDLPLINKKQVMALFVELGYPCKFITGGAYRIGKAYKNHYFEMNNVINKFSSTQIFFYLYINDEFVQGRVSGISWLLRYLPYDESMINKNYRLNSLEDLKNYLSDMIGLFNEFVDAYIEELKMEEAVNGDVVSE